MSREHDYSPFEVVVAGSSMEPTLLMGDRLEVEPGAGAPLKPGALIVFRTVGEDAVVCHRVVSVVPLGIRTWYVHSGDAVPQNLAIVNDSRVLGAVRSATRQGQPVGLRQGPRPPLRARLGAAAFAARHMAGALGRRAPRVMVSVSLQLDLATAPSPAPGGVTVREVLQADLDTTLAGAGLAVSTAAQVESVAPDSWRAFVAFEGSRPVHHTFVAFRPRGAVLFLCHTAPTARRRGTFRQVTRHIAATLRQEGHDRLLSSCSRSNRASLLAHTRSGFLVRATSYRPMIGSIDLRRWLRRLAPRNN